MQTANHWVNNADKKPQNVANFVVSQNCM